MMNENDSLNFKELRQKVSDLENDFIKLKKEFEINSANNQDDIRRLEKLMKGSAST